MFSVFMKVFSKSRMGQLAFGNIILCDIPVKYIGIKGVGNAIILSLGDETGKPRGRYIYTLWRKAKSFHSTSPFTHFMALIKWLKLSELHVLRQMLIIASSFHHIKIWWR